MSGSGQVTARRTQCSAKPGTGTNMTIRGKHFTRHDVSLLSRFAESRSQFQLIFKGLMLLLIISQAVAAALTEVHPFAPQRLQITAPLVKICLICFVK